MWDVEWFCPFEPPFLSETWMGIADLPGFCQKSVRLALPGVCLCFSCSSWAKAAPGSVPRVAGRESGAVQPHRSLLPAEGRSDVLRIGLSDPVAIHAAAPQAFLENLIKCQCASGKQKPQWICAL